MQEMGRGNAILIQGDQDQNHVAIPPQGQPARHPSPQSTAQGQDLVAFHERNLALDQETVMKLLLKLTVIEGAQDLVVLAKEADLNLLIYLEVERDNDQGPQVHTGGGLDQ